jgi:hypothetical protein
MKYIRIKNGACAVNDEAYNIKYIIPAEDYLTKYFFRSEHIKAQADTIEELCDMYVLADDEFKHVDLVSDYNDVRQMLSYDLFGQSCYGAIWTKDGLKFVAKRNCFGELELI